MKDMSKIRLWREEHEGEQELTRTGSSTEAAYGRDQSSPVTP
jgi:hypothetical protein